MSIDILAFVILLAIFVLGTLTSVNIGALGLVASFAFGTLVLGESASDIVGGFPADLFMLLFGITYLFSVATANGTMEWIVSALARYVVRGRPAVVPWLGFFVAAVATAAGAAGPAVAGLVSALGMSLAAAFAIRPFLVALMVLAGTLAGYFTPIGPIGVVANQTLANIGITPAPVTAFLAIFAFNTVLAVIIYFLFGGRSLLRARPRPAGDAAEADPVEASDPADGGGSSRTPDNRTSPAATQQAATATAPDVALTTTHVVTLVAIAAVATGALAFGLDIGFLGVCAAVLLHLMFPRKDAMRQVSWNIILLICGVVTYIETLDRAGTITRVGEALQSLGSPALTALLLCGGAALVSAFASSTATITAIIPIGAPLLHSGDVSAIGFFIAILLAASLVDATPLTSTGAMVVANTPADHQQSLYRRLLAWGLSMIVIGPLLACAVFVVPTLF